MRPPAINRPPLGSVFLMQNHSLYALLAALHSVHSKRLFWWRCIPCIQWVCTGGVVFTFRALKTMCTTLQPSIASPPCHCVAAGADVSLGVGRPSFLENVVRSSTKNVRHHMAKPNNLQRGDLPPHVTKCGDQAQTNAPASDAVERPREQIKRGALVERDATVEQGTTADPAGGTCMPSKGARRISRAAVAGLIPTICDGQKCQGEKKEPGENCCVPWRHPP